MPRRKKPKKKDRVPMPYDTITTAVSTDRLLAMECRKHADIWTGGNVSELVREALREYCLKLDVYLEKLPPKLRSELNHRAAKNGYRPNLKREKKRKSRESAYREHLIEQNKKFYEKAKRLKLEIEKENEEKRKAGLLKPSPNLPKWLQKKPDVEVEAQAEVSSTTQEVRIATDAPSQPGEQSEPREHITKYEW